MLKQNNIQIIKTGGDPSSYEEFEVIKSEINKMSHPKQPVIDWVLVESNALILFEKNGIDLLTISYYTLARYHRYGLAGFTEGCEILSALICNQWDNLWPQQDIPRVDALDWFNARIGSLLRRRDFSIKEMPLLQRACDSLEKLTDKLQQIPLSKSPRIENLYYFVQNNLEILEKNITAISKQNLKEPPKATLVYLPNVVVEGNFNNKEVEQEKPVPNQDKEIPTNIAIQYPSKKSFSWLSFGLGIIVAGVCSFGITKFFDKKAEQMAAVTGSDLIWFNKELFTQPDISLIDTPETRVAVFNNYRMQLHELSSLSPIAFYYYANNLQDNMQRLWPQHSEYKLLNTYWQSQLQAKTSYPLNISGYYNARKQLLSLKNEVNTAITEDRYITIMHLRVVIDNVLKELDSQLPTEEMLRQIEMYRVSGRKTPAKLKQNFDQQLQAILARYYQAEKVD